MSFQNLVNFSIHKLKPDIKNYRILKPTVLNVRQFDDSETNASGLVARYNEMYFLFCCRFKNFNLINLSTSLTFDFNNNAYWICYYIKQSPITVWTPNLFPCHTVLPPLSKLYGEYGKQKIVRVLHPVVKKLFLSK